MQLTEKERLLLIKGLEQVAESYFNNKPLITYFGICAALANLMPDAYDVDYYWLVDRVMRDMNEPKSYFEELPVCNTRLDWEQRAYMCLFLIEHIKASEARGIYEIADVSEESETKSLYQKVKGKLNELKENLQLYFEARDSLNRQIKGS
jgi:hypothetical protein